MRRLRVTLFVMSSAWLAVCCVALHGFGDTVNFEQHVRPVFREHCLGCHNAQKQVGGLSLETYAEVTTGGASGEVVYPGDLAGSRLWALVNHDEEPAMPPNQEKLPEAKLSVIRQWIEAGLLERADSAPRTTRTSVPLAMEVDVAAADGETGAMPEGLFRQPVTVSETPGSILSLAASPTAPLLAVGGPRQIVLYHVQESRLLGVLPFPEGSPFTLRFSRDGRWLVAGGGRGGLRGLAALFNLRDGRRIQSVGDEWDSVLAADVDVARQQVALGGPSRLVRVFDIRTGELRYEIKKHTDWVLDLEFSPDGRFLATAGRQGDLLVWEAEQGREYQTLAGHPAAITALSWRADSQLLATASEDGSLRLWGTEQAQPVRSWQAHAGGALDVDFDREGRLLSAGRDRRVRLWDATGKALADFPPLGDIAVESAVTHDSQMAVGGDWQGRLMVWTMEPPAEHASLVSNPISLEARVTQAEVALQDARQRQREQREALQAIRASMETTRRQYEEHLSQLVIVTQRLETQRLEVDSPADGDASDEAAQRQLLEREVGRLAAAARQQELDEVALRQALNAGEQEIDQLEARWQASVSERNRFREQVQILQQRVEEAEVSVESAEQKLRTAQQELELFQQSYPDD